MSYVSKITTSDGTTYDIKDATARAHALPSVTASDNGKLMQVIDGAWSLRMAAYFYTATIGTTWTGAEAPYSQVISVSGILATDNPTVDIVPSDTYATAVTQLEAWGSIYRIVTGANQITVYATEKTSVSIPIQIIGLR